jgi:AcrR family transcriptional regulator
MQVAETTPGPGDPRRTMELLWDVAPTATSSPRGPRPALTVAAIVAVATDIADNEGFDAVSMRAVGERLGRTAMALYTYVPSKGQLVDLMLDGAQTELDVPYDLRDGWRSAARRWALDSWAFYLRHPWVHRVWTARPVLGPGSYAALERPAAVFAAAGLTGPDVMKVVGMVSAYVVGTTRQVTELRAATAAAGQTEDQWWAVHSQLLAELVPDVDTRYPHLVQAEREGAFEFEHEPGEYLEQETRNSFEFGLDRMLDGIAAYLTRTSA